LKINLIFVVFPVEPCDNKGMDIQTASINLNLARVQEEAALLIQGKAMDMVEQQAVALDKLLASTQIIADPNVGQRVNISA
jgi:hypothetical protein